MTKNQTLFAVALEVVPGTVFQTFGIGHIYAGRTGVGLAIMASYWLLQAINTWLMAFGIGFVLAPLTWLAYVVLVPTDLLGTNPKKGLLTG